MVKNMTKRLFGIIALMVLMMATSLSASAYKLVGSVIGWDETAGLVMTQDDDGFYTIERDFVANEEFKIIHDGNWYSVSNGDITASLSSGIAIELKNDTSYPNMKVTVAGHYKIVLNASGNNPSMLIGVMAPVSYVEATNGCSLAVNKTKAIPGETVKITVTPGPGYYIERDNIKAEKTINGGLAQAPGLKSDPAGPGVGSFVDVVGDAVNSVDLENSYTFTMPAAPYGVQVSAEFQQRIAVNWTIDDIADQTVTGEAITPAIVVKDGENVVSADDYTVEYSNNIAVGQATVTVTAKGKYIGTATANFNIVKAKHNVTVADGIQNGTVALQGDVTQFVEGETVNITVTPNLGYEVGEVYYMDGENKVDIENNSFSMPDFDVVIYATFTAKDYAINVTQGEHGTIRVDGNKTTAHVNETVKLIAEADDDCEFVKFTVMAGDTEIEVNANGEFVMPASDVNVTATFKAYTVTYMIKWGIGDTWGNNVNTIAMEEDGEGKWITAQATEMDADAQFKVYREVRDGATFMYDNWLGKDVVISALPATIEDLAEGTPNIRFEKAGSYNFTYDPESSTLFVTGTIAPDEYNYTVETEANCFVQGAAGFATEGTSITMQIIPEEGYKFKEAKVYKVSGSGQDKVEEPIEFNVTPVEGDEFKVNLSFEMPASDVEVHVYCVNYYNISLDNGENGNAYIENEYRHAIEGDIVTVTTSPHQDYKVSEIYYTYVVDNEEQQGELTEGENGVYTFSMPAADVTVVVRYDYIIPRHAVKFFPESEGGTISVTANGDPINSMDQVAVNGIIEVTATPDPGYELDDLKVYEGLHELDDDFLGVPVVSLELIDGKYLFEMPLTDVTVIATFKQEEVELEGVTFNADRNWATYYNETKNLALPQGVKAFVVNRVVDDAVEITEVGYIPAGVGVLLYSEVAADLVKATLYTGEPETYTSKLSGSDEEQTITSGYVLYNNTFIRSEEGTLAAHRCYLPVDEAAGAPRILKIGYDGTVTAIDALIASGNVAAVKYVNLSGVTSNEPFRGINIAVVTLTDGTVKTVKIVK